MPKHGFVKAKVLQGAEATFAQSKWWKAHAYFSSEGWTVLGAAKTLWLWDLVAAACTRCLHSDSIHRSGRSRVYTRDSLRVVGALFSNCFIAIVRSFPVIGQCLLVAPLGLWCKYLILSQIFNHQQDENSCLLVVVHPSFTSTGHRPERSLQKNIRWVITILYFPCKPRNIYLN